MAGHEWLDEAGEVPASVWTDLVWFEPAAQDTAYIRTRLPDVVWRSVAADPQSAAEPDPLEAENSALRSLCAQQADLIARLHADLMAVRAPAPAAEVDPIHRALRVSGVRTGLARP